MNLLGVRSRLSSVWNQNCRHIDVIQLDVLFHDEKDVLCKMEANLPLNASAPDVAKELRRLADELEQTQ